MELIVPESEGDRNAMIDFGTGHLVVVEQLGKGRRGSHGRAGSCHNCGGTGYEGGKHFGSKIRSYSNSFDIYEEGSHCNTFTDQTRKRSLTIDLLRSMYLLSN